MFVVLFVRGSIIELFRLFKFDSEKPAIFRNFRLNLPWTASQQDYRSRFVPAFEKLDETERDAEMRQMSEEVTVFVANPGCMD